MPGCTGIYPFRLKQEEGPVKHCAMQEGMRSIGKLRKNSKFVLPGRAWHSSRGKLVARADVQPQQRNILRNETLISFRYKNSSSLQGFGHPLKAAMMLQGLQTSKKFSIENNIKPDMGNLHYRASYPEQHKTSLCFACHLYEKPQFCLLLLKM